MDTIECTFVVGEAAAAGTVQWELLQKGKVSWIHKNYSDIYVFLWKWGQTRLMVVLKILYTFIKYCILVTQSSIHRNREENTVFIKSVGKFFFLVQIGYVSQNKC